MIYLLLCAILFSALALHKAHRTEWSILAVMTFVNFILTCVLSSEGEILYVLVPVVTSAGAMSLCSRRTTLGFYQAIILFVTLIAYGALAFDISRGEHVLIYNNYEAVIYGLVGCQLVGIFPTIWAAYRDFTAGRSAWLFDNKRNKRA